MKTIVLTGSNRGIGLEVLKSLATQSDRLIVLVRDTQKMQALCTELELACDIVPCDLTSASSIEQASEVIAALTPQIDTLVHIAGAYNNQGFLVPFLGSKCERVWTSNCIGAYYLTQCLSKLLDCSEDPRCVFMASVVGHRKTLNLQTIQGNQPKHAYAQSKYGALLLADYFGRKNAHWSVLAAHPGYTNTGIFDGRKPGVGRILIRYATRLIAQSTEMGAQPMVAAILSEKKSGTYFVPSGMFELKGVVKEVAMRDYYSPQDTDALMSFLGSYIRWPEFAVVENVSSSH